MQYSIILKEIQNLKAQLSQLDGSKVQIERTDMSVAEFSALINSVKKYEILEKNDSAYFANVFDNDEYYGNITLYLDQIIRKISLKAEQKGVSLDTSDRLQNISRNVRFIIDVLSVEYETLLKADSKRWISKNGSKLRTLKKSLVELIKFQDTLSQIQKAQSNIIANVILSEFKILYKFFLYSIKIARARGDQLLLVEIAGMTDRIISMINPIFSGQSLKTDELIYHYLSYELRELKASSIGS